MRLDFIVLPYSFTPALYLYSLIVPALLTVSRSTEFFAIERWWHIVSRHGCCLTGSVLRQSVVLQPSAEDLNRAFFCSALSPFQGDHVHHPSDASHSSNISSRPSWLTANYAPYPDGAAIWRSMSLRHQIRSVRCLTMIANDVRTPDFISTPSLGQRGSLPPCAITKRPPTLLLRFGDPCHRRRHQIRSVRRLTMIVNEHHPHKQRLRSPKTSA